ncbi:MAG: hypothetical protein AAGB19_15210 [Cyanobacteria bacterium P01_F01_bin.3]
MSLRRRSLALYYYAHILRSHGFCPKVNDGPHEDYSDCFKGDRIRSEKTSAAP